MWILGNGWCPNSSEDESVETIFDKSSSSNLFRDISDMPQNDQEGTDFVPNSLNSEGRPNTPVNTTYNQIVQKDLDRLANFGSHMEKRRLKMNLSPLQVVLLQV